jgi:DNA-binding transcriptional regulator YiaG
MTPLVEKTTNRCLFSQSQGISIIEDRLPTNISYSIGSAIFTSDRSTTVTTQRYDRDLLAVLSMTTSGVKLHMAVPRNVLAKIITAVVELPVKSTQQSVNELRKLSGLTWKQLATLFGVSRRSVHFWASGEPLSSANQEKLNRTLDAVEYISRGSASSNRSLLMGIANDGKSFLELLAAGEFDRVKHLLGAGNAIFKSKGRLSPAAELSRVPPNPADLVDALQDSIHQEVGKSRAAKSVRSRNK